MVIKGCPRKNEEVSEEKCGDCKWFRIIKDAFVCLLDRARRPLVLRSKLKRLPLPKKGKNKMPVGRIGLDKMSADLGRWPVQREEEGWPKLDSERNETLMVSEDLEPQPLEEDSPPSDKYYPDQILTAIEKSVEGTTVPPEEQNDDLDGTELPERRGTDVKEQPAAPTPPTPPLWSPYDLIGQLLLNPEESTDPFGRPLPPEDSTDDFETWMP
jgi:hypothetical protein